MSILRAMEDEWKTASGWIKNEWSLVVMNPVFVLEIQESFSCERVYSFRRFGYVLYTYLRIVNHFGYSS